MKADLVLNTLCDKKHRTFARFLTGIYGNSQNPYNLANQFGQSNEIYARYADF